MLLRRKPLSSLSTRSLGRLLSTRASTILSALNIPTAGEISGVYDGEWKGSGEVVESVCPTTGEVLAHVKTASNEELQTALQRTREAYIHLRGRQLVTECALSRQRAELLLLVMSSSDNSYPRPSSRRTPTTNQRSTRSKSTYTFHSQRTMDIAFYDASATHSF